MALNRQRYAKLLAEDVRFFSPIEAELSVGRRGEHGSEYGLWRRRPISGLHCY